jgi:hypothetical protein
LANGCNIFGDSACSECPDCSCGFDSISDGTDCWALGECSFGEGCALSGQAACGRSDARLKTNVTTIEDALDKILKLNPVEFDWLESAPHYDTYKELGQIHSIGFIAQEVRAVIPQVVDLKDNGYYSIDYPKLNALLVEGIKEQQVFIEELQKLIEDLENEIN